VLVDAIEVVGAEVGEGDDALQHVEGGADFYGEWNYTIRPCKKSENAIYC